MSPQEVLLGNVARIVHEAGDIFEEALNLGADKQDAHEVVAAVASLQERVQERLTGIALPH